MHGESYERERKEIREEKILESELPVRGNTENKQRRHESAASVQYLNPQVKLLPAFVREASICSECRECRLRAPEDIGNN